MAKIEANILLEGLVAEAMKANGFAPGAKLIVAVSGGADSVALLATLCRIGYDCIAAHCNFHLRGAESDRDMVFVEELCRCLDIKLEVRHFDVRKHMEQTGKSIEMACRDLRYEWFESLLSKYDAIAIAVGHHLEDNLETLIMNLTRGSGIKGLCGIKPLRGHIVRPMLNANRADIEGYLKGLDINYINDSSNESDDFVRNRIRHHILPAIFSQLPNSESGMLTTMANVKDSCELFVALIGDLKSRICRPDGRYDLTQLIEIVGEKADSALYEIINEHGFTMTQCQNMLNPTASGAMFESKLGEKAYVDRGMLSIIDNDTCESAEYKIDISANCDTPIRLETCCQAVATFSPERNPNVIYLDVSAADYNHDWRLRHWHQGDRIKAFGMTGSKLVSDVFADASYSTIDKKNAWLLTCDGEIVWIVGLRASRLFRVTPDSDKYFKIKYIQ